MILTKMKAAFERKLLLVVLVCSLIGVFVLPTNAYAKSNSYDLQYDYNSDGLVDMEDVNLVYKALTTTGGNATYCIADMISAFRVVCAGAIVEESTSNVLYASDLEITEANNNKIINLLLSNFERVFYEDSDNVTFEFYENGEIFFTIIWDKTDVFYDDQLSEHLTSCEYNGINYQVFIRENEKKYGLNVIGKEIGPALKMVDYTHGITGAVDNSFDFSDTEYYLKDINYDNKNVVELWYSFESGSADCCVRMPFIETHASGGEKVVTYSFGGTDYTINKNGDTLVIVIW